MGAVSRTACSAGSGSTGFAALLRSESLPGADLIEASGWYAASRRELSGGRSTTVTARQEETSI